MKTHFVISAAAASICLSSCATDPALAQKKKSTSIGRFGVTHTTPVDPQAAPAPAPEPAAPSPAPAPATESVASAAPEAAPAPQRKAIFDWNPKQKEKPAVAAAPAPVEKSAPAPAPAPVQEAAPAPAKKNIFANWGKKKEPKVEETVAAAPAPTEKPAPTPAPVQEAAPAPKPAKKNLFAYWDKKKEDQAAASPQAPQSEPTAPAPSRKKNVSIGRFGVTYQKEDGQVAAAPAPVQQAAPAPEKKRFSWFKRKNDTQGAPIAVKVDEKPAEKSQKKEKSFSKPRIAKADEPVEFKERGKSGGLSGDIRLPEMLDLPEGKDLKSSGSGTKKTGKEGSVISRPPVEEKKD